VLKTLGLISVLLAAGAAAAQTKQAAPPVKVTVLNVCTPSAEERAEIAAALAGLPQQPRFTADYEVARGHTTLEGPPSDWVRIRRELTGHARWTGAQFSFSETGEDTREMTVFFSRETKGVTQVALEDKITPRTAAATVLAASTPVSRISIERFGKQHLVLTRCPEVDQSVYEPLFRTASGLMDTYRAALEARQIVTAEIGQRLADVDGRRPPKVKHMSPRKK
jgi:hypothetical protein